MARAAKPKSDAPANLAARGLLLWTDLRKEGPLGPTQRVLVEEACRIADRLDRLNKIITDEGVWAELVETAEGSGIAEIVVNKPLAEARQQALALKAILTELRQTRGAGSTEQGGDEVDELAVAREKRIAAARRR